MLKGDSKNPKTTQPHLTTIEKNPLASIASENRIRPDFSSMIEKWPSSIVMRDLIKEFSGGAMTPGYLANLDSAKKGPPGRFRCGRKIGYSVVELVKWLEDRSTVKGEDS